MLPPSTEYKVKIQVWGDVMRLVIWMVLSTLAFSQQAQAIGGKKKKEKQEQERKEKQEQDSTASSSTADVNLLQQVCMALQIDPSNKEAIVPACIQLLNDLRAKSEQIGALIRQVETLELKDVYAAQARENMARSMQEHSSKLLASTEQSVSQQLMQAQTEANQITARAVQAASQTIAEAEFAANKLRADSTKEADQTRRNVASELADLTAQSKKLRERFRIDPLYGQGEHVEFTITDAQGEDHTVQMDVAALINRFPNSLLAMSLTSLADEAFSEAAQGKKATKRVPTKMRGVNPLELQMIAQAVVHPTGVVATWSNLSSSEQASMRGTLDYLNFRFSPPRIFNSPVLPHYEEQLVKVQIGAKTITFDEYLDLSVEESKDAQFQFDGNLNPDKFFVLLRNSFAKKFETADGSHSNLTDDQKMIVVLTALTFFLEKGCAIHQEYLKNLLVEDKIPTKKYLPFSRVADSISRMIQREEVAAVNVTYPHDSLTNLPVLYSTLAANALHNLGYCTEEFAADTIERLTLWTIPGLKEVIDAAIALVNANPWQLIYVDKSKLVADLNHVVGQASCVRNYVAPWIRVIKVIERLGNNIYSASEI